MKAFLLTFLTGLALAAPNDLTKRQGKGKGAAPKGGKGGEGSTFSEFTNGGCKSAIFIYARGTGEPKNVVCCDPHDSSVFITNPSKGMLGRAVVRELKAIMPDVAIEGVNYAAAVQGNMTPGGADAAGIKMAQQLFRTAASKCPKAALLGGGYSQGAALMHRTVEALEKNVQARIAGVILYGDTKNKQDGGRIKNFPPDKVKIFCNKDDGVCGGQLRVNAGHMAYNKDFKPGAEFLATKAKALIGSG